MIDRTWLANLISVLGDTIKRTAPYIEGLADYLRLNIQDHTRNEVGLEQANLNRRLSLLGQALTAATALRTALDGLEGDGYPELPPRGITQAVLNDLKSQQDTMAAAMSLFEVAADKVSAVVSQERPTPE